MASGWLVVVGDHHDPAQATVVYMSGGVKWGAQLFVVLLCALGLKYHYSVATPDQLRWILAPTTSLVEIFSGRSFSFESYTGYMSSDHTFVIAAQCAGVNFLITAFLMLGFRSLWQERFHGSSWRFIPLVAAGAFVATLVANTVRICLALEMQGMNSGWLTANQLHRVEGIVVYFGFLLLLFMVFERLEAGKPSRWLLVFPLVVYYVVTLGVPLMNGSYRQGFTFFEHSFFVIVLPVLVLLPVVVWKAMLGRQCFFKKPCTKSTLGDSSEEQCCGGAQCL